MTPSETIADCRAHWHHLPPHAKSRETAIRLLKAIEAAEHLLAVEQGRMAPLDRIYGPERQYGPSYERNGRREME